MVTQNRGGAQIQAGLPKPCIDLATLVELLAKAISPKENRENTEVLHPDYYQLFIFDEQKKRLRLSTSAVVRRLFGNQDFKAAFNPAEGGGFIQNLSTMPNFGNRLRIGGYLKEDNKVKLPVALDKLISAIDAALPPESLLPLLLLDKPMQQLQQLAKAGNTSFNNPINTANLVPIAFPNTENKSKTQNKAVAKVISALERIDADDYFQRMSHALREYLQNQLNWNEYEIETAIDSFDAEQDRLDSQLTRFLNFLDDEALARVRLTITFRIMQAIAEHCRANHQPKYQILVEYVQRVNSFVALAKEAGYSVDLTGHFGVAAEFELLDYLNTAIFYSCLPVSA